MLNACSGSSGSPGSILIGYDNPATEIDLCKPLPWESARRQGRLGSIRHASLDYGKTGKLTYWLTTPDDLQYAACVHYVDAGRCSTWLRRL